MSEPNRETVTLRVILADAEQVQSLCGTFARGCYLRSDIEGLGLIVSEKPRDFNDEYRLMILGHEVFHALGATHD